jgi:hypothetical protein
LVRVQPADRHPVILDVHLDGVFVGEVKASTNRPDLAGVGLKNTFHGFNFPLPPAFLDGSQRQLTLRDRVLGALVPGTPRTVTLGRDVLRARSRPPQTPVRAITTSEPVNFAAAASPGSEQATIVILTRDGAEVLSKCLESIWWFVPRGLAKVVLVDHGSSRRDRALVAAWSDRLNLQRIRIQGNNSFSYGNNAAVRAHADTPYVLLLNNDVVLLSDVVTAFIDEMESSPEVGLVGCKLVEARDLADLSTSSIHHNGIQLGIGGDAWCAALKRAPRCACQSRTGKSSRSL